MKKGFTLIELIIVIVIIGILASISAPMMGNMKARAICAEAVTGLATMRTSLRQYFVEYNAYPEARAPAYTTSQSFPGINVQNLGGAYFGYRCYFLDTRPPTPGLYEGRIHCMPTPAVGGSNNAPRAADAQQIADSSDGAIYMYLSNGKITQSNFSRSGYEEEPNPAF